MSEDNNSRIAVLESEVKGINDSIKSLTKELEEFRKTFTSGKGFIMGVAAVIAPLWAIALGMVGTLFDKISNGWGH